MKPFRRSSSRQSKNFVAKRRVRSVFLGLGGILVIALLILALSWITSWKWLTITSVQISGLDPERAESLHASVLQSLQGDYLGVFPHSSTLIYPKGTIEDLVMRGYPEAQTFKVDRQGTHIINIAIHEKEPDALICALLPDFAGNELSLEDPGSCYFADTAGYIYKRAPSFSGTAYARYYIPQLADIADVATSTEDGLIGLRAAPASEYAVLKNYYALTKEAGMRTDALLVKGDGEYELYGRNPSASSTVVVYFNTVAGTSTQLANLISFWKHAVETGISGAKKPEFDYIDVRYGDNVFYRESK